MIEKHEFCKLPTSISKGIANVFVEIALSDTFICTRDQKKQRKTLLKRFPKTQLCIKTRQIGHYYNVNPSYSREWYYIFAKITMVDFTTHIRPHQLFTRITSGVRIWFPKAPLYIKPRQIGQFYNVNPFNLRPVCMNSRTLDFRVLDCFEVSTRYFVWSGVFWPKMP